MACRRIRPLHPCTRSQSFDERPIIAVGGTLISIACGECDADMREENGWRLLESHGFIGIHRFARLSPLVEREVMGNQIEPT